MPRLACVDFPAAPPAALTRRGREAIVRLLQRLTPNVEPLDPRHGFTPTAYLLDASGLASLYRSASRWARALAALLDHDDAHTLTGPARRIVIGFSRFGPWAIAQTLAPNTTLILRDPDDEERAVARVPLAAVMPETAGPTALAALDRLDIRTVGALAKLPTDGLRARYGAAVVDLHAQARGVRPIPIQAFTPEAPPTTALEFDPAESDTARMLFALKPALEALLAQAQTRHTPAMAVHIGLRFDHGRPQGTPATDATNLLLARPSYDARTMLDLVRLRFEVWTLPAAVEAVTLRLDTLRTELSQTHLALNGAPRRDIEAGARALAQVAALFGPGRVVRARLTDRHLPEARFAWEPIQSPVLPDPTDTQTPGRCGRLIRRVHTPPWPIATLSLTPGGALTMSRTPPDSVVETSGPYRLSGGWWRDGGDAARDYYFVTTARGRLLWVYRDQHARRWFLQGEVA